MDDLLVAVFLLLTLAITVYALMRRARPSASKPAAARPSKPGDGSGTPG